MFVKSGIYSRKLIAIFCFLGANFLCFPCFVNAESFENALRDGISKSNALASSRQDFIAARQELTIAASDKDLNGKFSISQNQAFYERSNILDNTYSEATLAGAITFTKQLYNSGETKARRKSAMLSMEIAKSKFYIAEQLVLISIIETYLNFLLSREEVKLHESNFERLEQQNEAEKLRVEAGVSTVGNLALSTSKMLSSRSELVASKAIYENSLEKYNSLIGEISTVLVEPKLPDIIPTKVQSSENLAYKNHPSLVLASASKELASLQQEILIKSLGPSVDLTLSANKRNTGGVSPTDGNEISANISMSLPILATPASKAQSQKLISNLIAAEIDSDEAKRVAGLAARAGFRNHISAKIQFKATLSEVEAYELFVEAIRTEVEFGNKTILDQLDAEDDLKNAILRRMRANYAVLLTGYRLLQATGTLTAENLGIGDALIPLEALENPESKINSLSIFKKRYQE